MPEAVIPAAAEAVPVGVPGEDDVLGRAGAENFVVASRLLLGPQRRSLLALYGFARLVDELGDSAPGDRVALLAWADRELERAAAGRARHPVFVRLGPVVAEHGLDLGLFHDLVEANRRDQVVTRYASFDQLLGYCALSANPVGRLVLGVFGAAGEEECRLSDSVCSGLQIIEHCQDVMEDAAAGRVYLPEEDLAAQGLSAADVVAAADPAGGPAAAFYGRLAQVVGTETERALGLLRAGAPLTRRLRGRCRWAVAAFVGGGLAAADGLARAAYDVTARPRTSKGRRLVLTLRAAGGRL